MSGFGTTFFVAMVISAVMHSYGGEHVTFGEEEEDMDLERQMRIINKHAVKTIKTEYGDIIDCVDINKQPAFDHPLLKNHRIQMKPSSITLGVKNQASSLGKLVMVSEGNGCPSGSVPIRRTTKKDLIRSKISKPANMFASPALAPDSHFEVVSVLPNPPGAILYGARAHINVHNPKVEYGQSSAAQIWISGGPSDQINAIEVGWVVDPGLYGDKRTRLFTHWTGDGYKKTGCYNILCPGFVQIDGRAILGEALGNISTFEGPQFIMMTYVYQDEKSGNWWFVYTDNNIHVGYWPKELFPHFSRGAPFLAYGGRAQGLVNHLSPPMGSGLKPDHSERRYYHACFFQDVQFLSNQRQLADPSGAIRTFNDNSGCYGLQNIGDHRDMGYTFLFGGPGGNCGN